MYDDLCSRCLSMSFNTLRDVDALLVPATAIPALPTAEVDADVKTYTERNLCYLRNTAIGNILLSKLST